jgi:replicative DNA helicase
MEGEKEKVVFISLEMTAEELAARGYTAEYLISNDHFAMGGGRDEQWLETLRKLEENSADIEKGMGRMIINDQGGMSLEKIRGYLHGLKTQGIEIRLIVVDYLQFIVTKGVNMVQEMGEVSRGLKNLAKDYQCPVVALSQLSRAPENRADHRPILSDLRESGNIEQDADVVMFLYRDEYYFPDSEKKGMAEMNIAKQRNGPTGAVDLRWIADSTTFRSLERFHKTTEEPPEKFIQGKLV